MNRKLLFIINPNAGKKISDQIVEIIREQFPVTITYQLAIWKNKNDLAEITSILKTQGYTHAIAVGGDGTVNQVAQSILGTEIILGIVPIGSGNGLARSLGLSMQIPKVLQQILENNTAVIDHGMMNGIPFFCTSGVGFDAHVGSLFANSIKRGLQGYIKIALREVFSYKAKKYKIIIDGKELNRKAFLITVANAGQYGNDFYIAPLASMQDGVFHVSVLKPFNIFNWPVLLYKIWRKKAHKSVLIETLSAKELAIIRENEDAVHFDGEPALEKKEVHYKCVTGKLKAIVGNTFMRTA